MPAFLAPFLLGLVGSVVARVLLSLGFAVITIYGMDTVIDTVKNHVENAANDLPADVYNLFLIAGGGVVLNIIFAAVSFRLTYWTLTKSVRIVGVKI